METLPFFSVRLLYVHLVDDGLSKKSHSYDESIRLVQARDHDEAWREALRVGQAHETIYTDGSGVKNRQAFIGVDEVKFLGTELLGSEIASVTYQQRGSDLIAFDHVFLPADQEPHRS
jgi:hypothetical protein